MARPLAISLYLTLNRLDEPSGPLPDYPDRPDGTVIWAVCGTAEDVDHVGVLQTALRSDGDQISVVTTGPTDIAQPAHKVGITRFLDHYRPSLVIWIGAPLDPYLLDHLNTAGLGSFVLEATEQAAAMTEASRIPALTRAVFGFVETIMAIDQSAALKLKAIGAEPDQVITMGVIEETPQPLPYNESERQDLARVLGTRPVWLVAGARLEELEMIATAHRQASRRAHRLLLIIATEVPAEAAPLADALRDSGFDVATRADDGEPEEATQIFIADGMDELGLWYRIAPVTFLAGTLDIGARRHPFEPAALGSAVLHGNHVAPYQQQIARLAGKGGSLTVRNASELGDAVETLLSADKVATMAHAAWDVTTQGADVAQQMAALVHARLDHGKG